MEQINVGLCAFGMSGKVFHAPFLNEHPGFSLSGIVERTKNESAAKYPQAKIFRSVYELLTDETLQLIIVNTPVQTHFEYVEKALLAGKNVIVEKPFTVNSTEAQKLIALAKEKNLALSVYQNRRFDRDFLQVKKIIAENHLGNIKEAEIRFDRYRTQASGKAHKENPQMPGAGALHDLGSHLIDQATLLFGTPETVFADVFSMKGNAFANDYFDLILKYQNDLRVRIKSSVFTKKESFAYKIHGENGSFLQERTDTQETELAAGVHPKYGEDWVKILTETDGLLTVNGHEKSLETKSLPGNYMHYYQQIFEHFVFGEQLPSPAEEILVNMQIIDAALQSAAAQKVISLATV